MNPHLPHPRDPRQSIRRIPADQARRGETEDPPCVHTCERCLTPYKEVGHSDDATRPIGDPTLVDTMRRVVAEQTSATIEGVEVDVWSASVTVLIWDNLCEHQRRHLLAFPSNELILRCIYIYASAIALGGS